MGARVVFEALRRRWKAKLAGLMSVAFGVAVLGALLHLVTQGEDRLALDLRGFGPNLVVRATEADALLDVSATGAIKTIFWRNNVTALAPELSSTVDADGGRVTLVGAWLDHEMPIDGVPQWRTGLVHLQPSWRIEGPAARAQAQAIEGDVPRDGVAPPEVLVGERIAAARGWKRGDVVTVSRGERSETLRVSGVLHAGDAWDERLVTTLEPVQRLLDREGRAADVLVSVLAKPDDEISRRPLETLNAADIERLTCSPYLSTVARQIEQAMPGAKAEPIRRVSEAESAYRSRLQALLALLAASAAILTGLGVHGSVRSALAERRTEMGLLQALGARRATIAALFLGEGLVVGFIGALLGAALGYGLASSLSKLVFGQALAFSPITLPVLIAAGVLLSAIGAGLAIRQALRLDTVSLLKSST